MKIENWTCIENVGGYSLINGRRTTLKAQKAILGEVCWDYNDLEEAEHEAMLRLRCFLEGIPEIIEEVEEDDFLDEEELELIEELEEDL